MWFIILFFFLHSPFSDYMKCLNFLLFSHLKGWKEKKIAGVRGIRFSSASFLCFGVEIV